MKDSNRRFVAIKRDGTEEIMYMEYEKLKGLSINPKNNLKLEDMINVNEMIIINPSLVKKLIDKKCNKKLEKILKMLSVIFDNNDDSSDAMDIALDEIEKFRLLVISKYKEYMDEQDFNLLMKKLEILENEIKLRQQFILNNVLNNQIKEGKGR